MHKFNLFSLSAAFGLLLPRFTLAQGLSTNAFDKLLTNLEENLEDIITFLVLVATVILIFGIVKYVGSGDDEDKVTQGRNLIIYGVIGLATIIMLWGLVRIVVDFVLDDTADLDIPSEDELPQQ